VSLRRAPGLGLCALVWTSAVAARGPDAPTEAESIAADWPARASEGDRSGELPRALRPIALPARYHFLAAAGFGRGIRFENPYRLQTELGKDAESLSLTATYLDLSFAALLGGHGSVFHGVRLGADFALDGIAQEVLTPSYLLFYRIDPRWALLARAGVPIVVEPDVNAGFELGGGGVFYLTAGFGLTASLAASLFFGAATLDSARPAAPILSMDLGLVYDYEVLP
jgi:hypothetical protein